MRYVDVFNGDADGICALIQLRAAEPRTAELVTGVKRDIALLDKVEAGPELALTVLDISLDKNRQSLERLLAADAQVEYFDHHFAGEIPASSSLRATINTASEVCTSLLVNNHLGGSSRMWAVVGAFGDNLKKAARGLARPLGLPASDLQRLEDLGVYLNYNGYGASLQDLHFEPADLYQLLLPHSSPLDFIQQSAEHFQTLEQGYHQDMAAAAAQSAEYTDAAVSAYVLPAEAWARRVSGVFGNDLANEDPGRAHAVLTDRGDGSFVVSVRAPLDNRSGADELCRQFATGGGRKAAAGINVLPGDQLQTFIDAFAGFYR